MTLLHATEYGLLLQLAVVLTTAGLSFLLGFRLGRERGGAGGRTGRR